MPDETRFFTLSQANRTLPLVRRIVRDIIAVYPGFQERLRRISTLSAAPRTAGIQRQIEALREEVDGDAERLNGFVSELNQIGCDFKGFELGVVDFPARVGRRVIAMCWQYGEDRISHWHEPETGFDDRKPITPEMERVLNKEDSVPVR
jgi:hypothetical protein